MRATLTRLFKCSNTIDSAWYSNEVYTLGTDQYNPIHTWRSALNPAVALHITPIIYL